MQYKNNIKNILGIVKINFLVPFFLSLSIILIVPILFNLKVGSINNFLLLYTGVIFSFISFFLWFKDRDSNIKVKKLVVEFCLILFLMSLCIITISNLNLLTRYNPLIINNLYHVINLIFIFSGLVIIYDNRNKILNNIQNDNKSEADEVQKKSLDFHKKFPIIAKIPIVREFLKWAYLNGFWYVITLLVILIIGATLRCWDLNYIQWSDNFNFISAKALYQNGNFIYNRNTDYTLFTGYLFYLFKPSLLIARIFPIIFGIVSIFFVYVFGKIFNKKVGLISAFLFAISPVAIEQSSMVREYTLNLFIFLLATIFLFSLFNKGLRVYKKVLYCSLVLALIYLYSILTVNTTLPIILFGLLIISLYLILYENKDFKFSLIPAIAIMSVIFNFFISKFDNFYHGFLWNTGWFNIFFNPKVNYPMQWFNGSNINIILIFFIFLIPLFFKLNRKILLCYTIFFFYIILFVFKFQDNLTYLASRYLYHIQFIYTFIFALSFYILYIIYKHYFYKIFILIFIFSCMVILPNTLLSTTHYSNPKDYNNGNYPRVTSIGSRPDVGIFLNNLQALNIIKKNYPIVLEGLDQSAIIYKFDYDIDKVRNYVIHNGIYTYYYDIGTNIYLEDESNNLLGLRDAILDNKEGIFITYRDIYPESNFTIGNTKFTFISTIYPKKIYRWDN